MSEPSRVKLPAALWALVLGGLHALSFAPWTLWWLQLLALALLLALWLSVQPDTPKSSTVWRRAALPFVFSMTWFTSGLCWLYISMHDYGGLPMPMAAAAVLLCAAYLSLYPCLAFIVSEKLAPYCATAPAGARFSAAITFAACWTLSEWLRGWVFTGFPWLATGYAHVDSPLVGWAPLAGVFAVSGFAALVAFCLADLLQARAAASPRTNSLARIMPLAGLVIAVLAIGHGLRSIEWSSPIGTPIKVRLLQGNVPQQLKFVPEESRRAMQNYARMITQPSKLGELDMTVTPETAWTMPWPATDPRLVREVFPPESNNPKQAVLLGMPLAIAGHGDASGQITYEMLSQGRVANSVVLLRSDRLNDLSQRYDKQHLVPFGEFIPWGFGWFVRMMNIPLGTFARGSVNQPPFTIAEQRVAFNICYEDLFGEELAPGVRASGGRASIMVNVSNIAWFGRSHALTQHLQISRLRAIELARPMLRATNTGMTASIDARGVVRAQLPHHSVGVLEDLVQGMQGDTPFARWTNVPALAVALIALAAAAFRIVRRP